MSPTPLDRPAPREAGPELLVLQKWEELTSWLLDRTAGWPKCVRFTLTQRIEDHALDVTEMLVLARYDRRRRPRLLHEVNLRLERMRYLLRLARSRNATTRRSFEAALRGIDECGRMIHGWRQTLGKRPRSTLRSFPPANTAAAP